MLDENLPTFHFKPPSDAASPLTSIVYFTQNGADPTPEYLLRRGDPQLPAQRNKYAVALADPFASDVIYAECVVEPDWQQPTLSAAEVRAQHAANGDNTSPSPAVASVPDTVTLGLFNPDQSVPLRLQPGAWNKTEAWEFELPTQTFHMPSASELDRQNGPAAAAELAPKVTFRWKRDGRLSKDMTCYMTGRSVGGRPSKEPDITVALFKHAREPMVTIYEPNLRRVEVEDRKGLEIVLVLGAEVIRDLWIAPRTDAFNTGAPGSAPAARRKNSRPMAAGGANSPSPGPGGPSPPTMSGAVGGVAAAAAVSSGPRPVPTATPPAASSAHIDAETRRLQAMVEKEEREREQRDKADQKRIKQMLEAEDKERRRREAEVAKETERLRKKYGVQGQNLPSLPPRPANNGPSMLPPPPPGAGGWPHHQQPPPPPRPLSADPSARPAAAPGPFGSSTLNSWWRGPAAVTAPAPQQQQQQQPPPQPPANGRRPNGGAGVHFQNAAASASQFFHRSDNERQKIQKKRSMHW